MKRVSRFLLCAAAAALFQTSTAPVAFADPILGADLFSFAVLGSSEVTSGATGSTIGGNVGSFPTASTTGIYNFLFGGCDACTFGDPDDQGGFTAAAAQGQLTAAIGAINAGAADFTPVGGVLAGTLGPGTYDVAHATTANIIGALTLDGGGAINPVWRFRFSSDFVTAEGSTVTVQNVGGDGSGAGLYWTAVSSAILNGDTMAGNVFTGAEITTNGGLTISCGRLASADAGVNLNGGGNTVSIGGLVGGAACAGFDEGAATPGEGGTAPIPEPGTLALLGSGIAAVVARRRRSARARQQDLAPKA